MHDYNIDEIVTSVKVHVLNKFLVQSGFPDEKREFLIQGFSKGFKMFNITQIIYH